MKRDEELGTWNGILNASHLNDRVRHPEHAAMRVSLTSESSPLSSFSNGYQFSGDVSFSNGYRFSGDVPSYSDIKRQTPHDNYLTEFDSHSSDFQIRRSISDKWVDDLRLCKDFYGMNITDRQGNNYVTKTMGYEFDSSRVGFDTCSSDANIPFFTGTASTNENICNEVPNCEGVPSSTWRVSPNLVADMKWALPVESSLTFDQSGAFYSDSNWNGNQIYHLMEQRKKQWSSSCDGEIQLQGPSFVNPYLRDGSGGSQPCGMDYGGGRSVKSPLRFSQMVHPQLALNLDNPSHCPTTRATANTTSEFPQFLSSKRAGGDPVAFRCDNSFIIQGKDIKYCIDNGCNFLRSCKKNCHNETAIHAVEDKITKHISHTPSQLCENSSGLASGFPLPMLLTFYSMAEVQGYIYNLAKDQNGCRFLQRMIDEGTSKDTQIVFEGIIDNVVELMMDPFGNYLVQKLLDVCREEQKLQIVFMVTKEPEQLVRISLNTHGTRVVQKLIETLHSRKQISLVKSALQPGFLDLIKDLNGNHVIQRCLQCLSCQDNEFIFDAATKFCVDIATHRHGCCVLQRCIDHAVGKYRDKLVTEICRHGLLLAQDPFGNYVVQYIIEMEIPTASAKLIPQFKGNYVILSTQKFSSHVVEKCLKHVGESRSRIVREMLSAPHFEQLLQDPYANYVIQSALAVTKGSLHASLVEAVRSHKILRTSPYCKRIFSGSLLRK